MLTNVGRNRYKIYKTKFFTMAITKILYLEAP